MGIVVYSLLWGNAGFISSTVWPILVVDPGRPGLSDEAALLSYLKRCRYL